MGIMRVPSLFEGLQIGRFGFLQKETGAKSVAMATTQKVFFCFFCDAHKKTESEI